MSFTEDVCSLLAAVVKEETKEKKLKNKILIPLSPLPLFSSYLVLGGETRGLKGGEKKNPQNSKEWQTAMPLNLVLK